MMSFDSSRLSAAGLAPVELLCHAYLGKNSYLPDSPYWKSFDKRNPQQIHKMRHKCTIFETKCKQFAEIQEPSEFKEILKNSNLSKEEREKSLQLRKEKTLELARKNLTAVKEHFKNPVFIAYLYTSFISAGMENMLYDLWERIPVYEVCGIPRSVNFPKGTLHNWYTQQFSEIKRRIRYARVLEKLCNRPLDRRPSKLSAQIEHSSPDNSPKPASAGAIMGGNNTENTAPTRISVTNNSRIRATNSMVPIVKCSARSNDTMAVEDGNGNGSINANTNPKWDTRCNRSDELKEALEVMRRDMSRESTPANTITQMAANDASVSYILGIYNNIVESHTAANNSSAHYETNYGDARRNINVDATNNAGRKADSDGNASCNSLRAGDDVGKDHRNDGNDDGHAAGKDDSDPLAELLKNNADIVQSIARTAMENMENDVRASNADGESDSKRRKIAGNSPFDSAPERAGEFKKLDDEDAENNENAEKSDGGDNETEYDIWASPMARARSNQLFEGNHEMLDDESDDDIFMEGNHQNQDESDDDSMIHHGPGEARSESDEETKCLVRNMIFKGKIMYVAEVNEDYTFRNTAVHEEWNKKYTQKMKLLNDIKGERLAREKAECDMGSQHEHSDDVDEESEGDNPDNSPKGGFSGGGGISKSTSPRARHRKDEGGRSASSKKRRGNNWNPKRPKRQKKEAFTADDYARLPNSLREVSHNAPETLEHKIIRGLIHCPELESEFGLMGKDSTYGLIYFRHVISSEEFAEKLELASNEDAPVTTSASGSAAGGEDEDARDAGKIEGRKKNRRPADFMKLVQGEDIEFCYTANQIWAPVVYRLIPSGADYDERLEVLKDAMALNQVLLQKRPAAGRPTDHLGPHMSICTLGGSPWHRDLCAKPPLVMDIQRTLNAEEELRTGCPQSPYFGEENLREEYRKVLRKRQKNKERVGNSIGEQGGAREYCTDYSHPRDGHAEGTKNIGNTPRDTDAARETPRDDATGVPRVRASGRKSITHEGEQASALDNESLNEDNIYEDVESYEPRATESKQILTIKNSPPPRVGNALKITNKKAQPKKVIYIPGQGNANGNDKRKNINYTEEMDSGNKNDHDVRSNLQVPGSSNLSESDGVGSDCRANHTVNFSTLKNHERSSDSSEHVVSKSVLTKLLLGDQRGGNRGPHGPHGPSSGSANHGGQSNGHHGPGQSNGGHPGKGGRQLKSARGNRRNDDHETSSSHNRPNRSRRTINNVANNINNVNGNMNRAGNGLNVTNMNVRNSTSMSGSNVSVVINNSNGGLHPNNISNSNGGHPNNISANSGANGNMNGYNSNETMSSNSNDRHAELSSGRDRNSEQHMVINMMANRSKPVDEQLCWIMTNLMSNANSNPNNASGLTNLVSLVMNLNSPAACLEAFCLPNGYFITAEQAFCLSQALPILKDITRGLKLPTHVIMQLSAMLKAVSDMEQNNSHSNNGGNNMNENGGNNDGNNGTPGPDLDRIGSMPKSGLCPNSGGSDHNGGSSIDGKSGSGMNGNGGNLNGSGGGGYGSESGNGSGRSGNGNGGYTIGSGVNSVSCAANGIINDTMNGFDCGLPPRVPRVGSIGVCRENFAPTEAFAGPPHTSLPHHNFPPSQCFAPSQTPSIQNGTMQQQTGSMQQNGAAPGVCLPKSEANNSGAISAGSHTPTTGVNAIPLGDPQHLYLPPRLTVPTHMAKVRGGFVANKNHFMVDTDNLSNGKDINDGGKSNARDSNVTDGDTAANNHVSNNASKEASANNSSNSSASGNNGSNNGLNNVISNSGSSMHAIVTQMVSSANHAIMNGQEVSSDAKKTADPRQSEEEREIERKRATFKSMQRQRDQEAWQKRAILNKCMESRGTLPSSRGDYEKFGFGQRTDPHYLARGEYGWSTSSTLLGLGGPTPNSNANAMLPGTNGASMLPGNGPSNGGNMNGGGNANGGKNMDGGMKVVIRPNNVEGGCGGGGTAMRKSVEPSESDDFMEIRKSESEGSDE